MRVLIGCEESQTITKAFRELGHEAFSCDLKPCSGGHPEWHLKGDFLDVVRHPENYMSVERGYRVGYGYLSSTLFCC